MAFGSPDDRHGLFRCRQGSQRPRFQQPDLLPQRRLPFLVPWIIFSSAAFLGGSFVRSLEAFREHLDTEAPVGRIFRWYGRVEVEAMTADLFRTIRATSYRLPNHDRPDPDDDRGAEYRDSCAASFATLSGAV